jgi:hypothetical protein
MRMQPLKCLHNMTWQVEEGLAQQASRINAAIEEKIQELIDAGVSQRASEVSDKVRFVPIFTYSCMYEYMYMNTCV